MLLVVEYAVKITHELSINSYNLQLMAVVAFNKNISVRK